MKFKHTFHKELWLWLAENPQKLKITWFRINYENYKKDDVYNECFACDYKVNSVISGDCTEICPLTFTDFEGECLGGLYEKWHDECDLILKKKLALKIASLKVKSGIDYE